MRIIKVTEPIILPTLPNFLRTDYGTVVPIEAITDDGLRKVGRLWTQALVRKAKTRRKEPSP